VNHRGDALGGNDALQEDACPIGLKDTDEDCAIPGVLGDLSPPLLSLLVQLLEVGNDSPQELQLI